MSVNNYESASSAQAQSIAEFVQDLQKGRPGSGSSTGIDADALTRFIDDMNKGRQGGNPSLQTESIVEFVQDLQKGRPGSGSSTGIDVDALTGFIDDMNKGRQGGAATKLIKSSRLGANIPGMGAVLGVGGAILTSNAHADQRDYADMLHAQGVISEDALKDYYDLNSRTENSFSADIGISTVDPTGISIVVTGIVEINALLNFKDWADKYAPHLNEDQFQALSMSAISDNSARTDMLLEAVSMLPNSTENVPEFLHAAIEANNAFEVARMARIDSIDEFTDSIDSNEYAGLTEAEDRAYENLIAAMEATIANPQYAESFLNSVPIDDRLDYVRSLAASESDSLAFTQNHPEVAAYVASDGLWESFVGSDEEAVLINNTALINAYILERSGSFKSIVVGHENTSDDAQNVNYGDFTLEGATYAGDVSLIQEAAGASIAIDPSLLSSESITEEVPTIGSLSPKV